MNLAHTPHSWDLTPKEAIRTQRKLATQIVESPPGPIRTVAGIDAAFSSDGKHCIGGVVLWDVKQQIVVEQHTALAPLRFPYVPGLLSFRESPALLAALAKLGTEPDAIMCDGHGIAHPRRFGIACHIGILLNRPSLGCGKSRLVGVHREPGPKRGARTRLRLGTEVVGCVLRTRHGVKPIYVSIGHKIDLRSAERLTLSCARGYRLPEPTRLADKLVARKKIAHR